MNSTPADSRARRIASRLLATGTDLPVSKFRTGLSPIFAFEATVNHPRRRTRKPKTEASRASIPLTPSSAISDHQPDSPLQEANLVAGKIDKSKLTFGEPRRLRT